MSELPVPEIPEEAAVEARQLSRRSFIAGVCSTLVAVAGVSGIREIFFSDDQKDALPPQPTTLDNPSQGNNQLDIDEGRSTEYSAELRERAKNEPSLEELVDFARKTEWFAPVSLVDQIKRLADKGVVAETDTSKIPEDDYEGRGAIRSLFAAGMEDLGIDVIYDFDPYTDKPLRDIDQDATTKQLTANLLGMWSTLSSTPKRFIDRLERIFANEDRSIVSVPPVAGQPAEKTHDNYLSVINVEGKYQYSLVANVRGAIPESSQFDMMHEGTHVLQGDDDSAELFASVKALQPPLGAILEWFNTSGINLPQSALIKELLDNMQNVDYEDLAGATTAVLRKGFVEVPRNADPATAAYLDYLLDKQVAAVEWATRKTGIDIYKYIAFRRRFGNIHPAEVLSAYEQGLFDDMSPYDGTLSEVYADQMGLKSMNDLRGVERAVIPEGGLAGSYLVLPDRAWPDHMQIVIMRPDLELFKPDQNSDALDPLLFEALNALFYDPVEVVRSATFDALLNGDQSIGYVCRIPRSAIRKPNVFVGIINDEGDYESQLAEEEPSEVYNDNEVTEDNIEKIIRNLQAIAVGMFQGLTALSNDGKLPEGIMLRQQEIFSEISLMLPDEKGKMVQRILAFPTEINDSHLSIVHTSVKADESAISTDWRQEHGVDPDEPVFVKVTDTVRSTGIMAEAKVQRVIDVSGFGHGVVINKPEEEIKQELHARSGVGFIEDFLADIGNIAQLKA